MSDPIEDAARAFLANAPIGGPSVSSDDIDILLGRAERFQKILQEAGNAPFAEAAILGRLIRLLLPGAGEDLFRAADDEIRKFVGLNDD